MGRSAAPDLDTVWPSGADPKTLVCIRAQCTVTELFDTLFVASDLQEQLHKQRGDTELVEHPWVASKDEVPQESYTWEAQGEPNKPSANLRYRKVRFKSPPAAIASKPFQNEELQVLTQMVPGQQYVLEAISSTSAPYGDKFNVFFRYTLRADGPAAAVLHLVFHVEFLPSMSRMLKPVVAPAVDAGVRGTFKMFRSILGTLRSVADIKESELPSGPLPAAAGEEAEAGAPEPAAKAREEAAAHVPHAVAAATPGAAHAPGAAPVAPGPPPGLVSVLTQQLVVKEQVVLLADLVGAGLRSVTHSDGGAQLLAALLTVWLISITVAVLRGWQALCAPPPPGAGGLGRGLAAAFRLCFCWPLRLVDVPDSTMEVLSSLALVAGINLALIRGSEAAVRYLNHAHPGFMASIRAYGSGGGGAGGGAGAGAAAEADGGGGGDVIGGVAFGQVAAEAAAASAASAAAAGGPGRPGSGGGGGAAAPSTAGSAGPKAAPSATAAQAKDKGKGDKAATTAPSPAAKPQPPKAKPMRAAPAPKQFTPAQLRQLELGQISTTKSAAPASARSPSPPPASSPPPPAAAVPAPAAMADAWVADLSTTMVAKPEETGAAAAAMHPAQAPVPSGSPRAGPPPPSAAPFANGRSSVSGTPASSVGARTPDGGAANPMSPGEHSPTKGLVSSPGPTATPAASSTGSFATMFTKEGMDSMAETLRSAFRWDVPKPSDSEPAAAAPSAVAMTAPGERPASPAGALATGPKLKARSEAGVPSGSGGSGAASPEAAGGGAAAASTAALGGGGAAATAATPSYPQAHHHHLNPHPHSAAHYAVLHSTSARSLGGAIGIAGGPHLASHLTTHSLYSARSDSPLLGGGGAAAASGSDGSGGDDEDGASWVVEEVFENERFQPFRGWGHMWPGHFLPSDRVGHWSDRQGKPGGSASMVFEQVVPQLPRGWRWVEEEWQIDVDGIEQDAVDADGWTYALDFYLLKYPPPPQGGKCSMKHFVRRRRYFRTRVRASERALLSSVGEEEGWDGKESLSAVSEGASEGPRRDAGEDGSSGIAATSLSLAEGLPPSTRSQEDAASAIYSHAGGGSHSPAVAAVEDITLRPSSAPAAGGTTAAAGGASGGSVPRQRSEPEALRQAREAQPSLQGARSDGAAGQASTAGGGQHASPTAPVAATLSLLSGMASDPFPAAGVRGPSMQPAPAAEAAAAAAVGGDDAGFGRRSGEDFVLSPKTVVTAADPLGAYAEDAESELAVASDDPASDAFGSWKGARPGAGDGPDGMASVDGAATAPPAQGRQVSPTLLPGEEAEATQRHTGSDSLAPPAVRAAPSHRDVGALREQAGTSGSDGSGSGGDSPAAPRQAAAGIRMPSPRSAMAAAGPAVSPDPVAGSAPVVHEGPIVAADLVD